MKTKSIKFNKNKKKNNSFIQKYGIKKNFWVKQNTCLLVNVLFSLVCLQPSLSALVALVKTIICKQIRNLLLLSWKFWKVSQQYHRLPYYISVRAKSFDISTGFIDRQFNFGFIYFWMMSIRENLFLFVSIRRIFRTMKSFWRSMADCLFHM